MTQIYTQASASPLLERPSFVVHTQVHHTPRSTTFRYSPPSETSSDQQRQPSSSMSVAGKGFFEVISPKASEMYRPRQEVGQPREQLPPLSSLFGAAPPRPSSAYSNRHSPTFAVLSPHDARQPTTPLPPSRPYETSYFQSRPSLERPFTFTSRPEHTERLGLPQPPRHAAPNPRPESPCLGVRLDASKAPYLAGSWSPRSQGSRPEYVGRDTSSSFSSHMDHLPPPPHRVEPKYHESHSAQACPPTPNSAVASDLTTSKDGLGPKIWTGTHFLPRFVRQAEVPGEGLCYFYDDGSHCKTVIDGEVVNAHWGVTKAGKPRKRLAIACITCREKKIKCDPDYPRCVQCEKFGRICKFKNAPRGGQGSPDTPPAEPEEIVSRPGSSREDAESFHEKREHSSSVSPRQVLRHDTPESEVPHAKRQRTGYGEFTPVPSEGSPQPSVHHAASPVDAFNESLITSTIDPILIREWRANPYTVNKSLTTELIGVFFRHVPETANCIFAQGPFTAWVLSSLEKSLDDLMLIYTVLALASIFSPKPEHRILGSHYSSISRFSCHNRPFSLQLVQARLLLALYSFANNDPELAWDLCGGAVRAASGLKLNLEMEKTDDAYRKNYPYGFTRAGYAECRRRTFWSCYLMDRFNGFCSGHISIIHAEDIFLRLPCDVTSFESQADTQNPFFDPNTCHAQNYGRTVGGMAYLINITTIWGEVMANIYRMSQRPSPSSSAIFINFYETTNLRLLAWKKSLPPKFAYSRENVKCAITAGNLGTFMMMHTVYHMTAMKLNRYIPHRSMTASHLTHHRAAARQAAEDLLHTVDVQVAYSCSTTRFSSPFLGYAIVSAADIITSRFALASLPDLLQGLKGGLTILTELALYWQSSKNQTALVQQRVIDLKEFSADGHLMSPVVRPLDRGIFEIREPLERTFEREYDSVYC